MTQDQRLDFLIQELLKEQGCTEEFSAHTDKKQLFRSLVNTRPPMLAAEEFLRIQDEYLQAELKCMEITSLDSLAPLSKDLYLWRGDITTLKVDAIVNAANSQMLGCWLPCHACIDNCIHTFAGIQLRLACAKIMEQQGHPEKTGAAKITPAFNLPSRSVIHTVGPIVGQRLTERDCQDLASCYFSCLALAEQNNVSSLAFCCISTGVFHFPNDIAAEIAIHSVQEYKKNTKSPIKVVFNVFSEKDEALYRNFFRNNCNV